MNYLLHDLPVAMPQMVDGVTPNCFAIDLWLSRGSRDRIAATSEGVSFARGALPRLYSVPCLRRSSAFSATLAHLRWRLLPQARLLHECAASVLPDGAGPCVNSHMTRCDEKKTPSRLKRPYPLLSRENGHSTQASCSGSASRSTIQSWVFAVVPGEGKFAKLRSFIDLTVANVVMCVRYIATVATATGRA